MNSLRGISDRIDRRNCRLCLIDPHDTQIEYNVGRRCVYAISCLDSAGMTKQQRNGNNIRGGDEGEEKVARREIADFG